MLVELLINSGKYAMLSLLPWYLTLCSSFVCPIIACTVEDAVSPRWVYTPSADREAWLDLAFAIEERGNSLNTPEFIQRMNFKRLPYTGEHGTTAFFRVYLLTTSKECDDDHGEYAIYFHGTHSIIDGRPALHALNLMCEWISGKGMDVKIEPLEEWKNLPVDPVTATGGPSPEWETAGIKLMQVLAEQNARTTVGLVPNTISLFCAMTLTKT